MLPGIQGFINYLRYPPDYNLNHPLPWKDLSPTIGINGLILGIMFSTILLELKFSSEMFKKMEFFYIPIPLWIGSVIAAISTIPHADNLCKQSTPVTLTIIIGYLSLFSSPIMFTLIALYVERSNGFLPSLWYATIPIIPVEFCLILIMFFTFYASYELLRDWYRGNEIVYVYSSNNRWWRQLQRLTANISRSILMITMVTLLIYFNYSFYRYEGSNNLLATTIVCAIAFVLCFSIKNLLFNF